MCPGYRVYHGWQMCARYTANPLSNCVLGLSLGRTRTTVQALQALNVYTMHDESLKAQFAIPGPYVFMRNSILSVITIPARSNDTGNATNDTKCDRTHYRTKLLIYDDKTRHVSISIVKGYTCMRAF